MSESQVKILHVDDNETNRYVVTRMLQRVGFTVLEASTGAEGLAAIAAHHPTLVILDVKLPDISGFDVCRQIKANPDTAFIPVLHLSASFVQSQDKAEGLESGADAYLAQPVEAIELIATVRSLLRIRRAEELALSSARDWQTTFDAISDGVCLVDRSNKILRCNRAMTQLCGKPLNAILGYVYHEFTHATLDIGDGACFRRANETHQRQIVELQGRGRWFAKTVDPVLDEHGTCTGAVCILADITARKQAEAALRDSEELKQRILESSHDCIKLLTVDGLLLYINQGGLRLLEVEEPTTILNTPWLNCWHGEDRAQAQAAIAAAQAGQVGQFQGYCPTATGQPRWWDVIVTTLQNASGAITQLLVVSRDITKQKQADTEREQLLSREQVAREQAETANRIKDEFLAVLSHELRSPLNPILGWAKILQTSQQDEAKTQYALETIERNAKLQAQLIEDLLDVSRILQGKLSLNTSFISLTFTIKAALETVRLAAEAKSIQIQTVFEPDVGQVLGDSGRLQQVVWNLLSNAVKFTPSGGKVQVRLASPPPHTAAQIVVSDTGKGISAEFLPYVFDYFRQADSSTTRRFGGLGLGLAIVRHLVELHGGTVEVDSPGEGQGAVFTVTLPIQAVTRFNPAQQSPHDRAELNLNGLRVLLVDDDTDSRELVSFLLNQQGATVTEAASACVALHQFEHTPFDLVISDIEMPDMDGYTLIRQIRKNYPAPMNQIPAIALTAYAGESDRQQALAAGFQHHLSKPIEPDLLMQTIWTFMPRNE